MKKLWPLIPAVALALVGCNSSSSGSSTATAPEIPSDDPPPPPAPQKKLPTDYIVVEMGSFEYTGSGLTITKGVCKDKANKYDWSTVPQSGSIAKNDDGSVNVDLGDGNGTHKYEYKSEGSFPKGDYFLSSMLDSASVWGFSLAEPKDYSAVIYPPKDCIFKYFGEMVETFGGITETDVSDNAQLKVGCSEILLGDFVMTYVSNTETSIDYKISFGGKSCKMHQDFLYAYSEKDCELAFSNYQQEYEAGETTDFFDFDKHDQDITAEEACVGLLADYNGAAVLAKKATVSEKQIKKILKAAGASLRKQK